MILGFPGDSDGKESTCSEGDLGSIPGLVRSQEEGMATHSSILAWRIPTDREAWQTTHSPWGRKESDTTGQLNTAHRLEARESWTQDRAPVALETVPATIPHSVLVFFWMHCEASAVPSPWIFQSCPLQWKHGVLDTGPPGNSPSPDLFRWLSFLAQLG